MISRAPRHPPQFPDLFWLSHLTKRVGSVTIAPRFSMLGPPFTANRAVPSSTVIDGSAVNDDRRSSPPERNQTTARRRVRRAAKSRSRLIEWRTGSSGLCKDRFVHREGLSVIWPPEQINRWTADAARTNNDAEPGSKQGSCAVSVIRVLGVGGSRYEACFVDSRTLDRRCCRDKLDLER